MSLVPDVKVVFELNKRRLTLEYRQLPLQAWDELKSALGWTPKTLVVGLEDWDLQAIGALIWLERKQRERNLSWTEARADINNNEPDFDIVDLVVGGKSLTGRTGQDTEQEGDPTRAGS